MSEPLDTTEGTEGGKGLRAQLETALSELTKLREENEKFAKQNRQSAVAGILKAKGIDESVAELYGGDDVSEDAVGKWVERYGKAFGVEVKQAPAELDANAQAAQRVSDASFGTQSVTETSLNSQIVGDHDDLIRLMKTLPREELQKRGMLPGNSAVFGRS